MHVTLMTDASYCNQTRVGGYGYYAVRDGLRHSGGGEFKKKARGPDLAEFWAVIRALSTLRSARAILSGDTVLVQTDSVCAIRYMTGAIPSRPEYREALDLYKQVSAGLEVRTRHVKAHSGVRDNRSMANNLCDRIAKEHMAIARMRELS